MTRAQEEIPALAADALCRTAVWHDDRCCWIGAEPSVTRRLDERTWGALGPDLYGGTAGVGLVLAHVARVTGDRAAARTALGALRHALTGAEALPKFRAMSLFPGGLGVAVAAAWAAAALNDEELRCGTTKLTTSLLAAPDPTGSDLIAGRAGTIVGLLALSAGSGDPRLIPRARSAAERLIAEPTTGRLTGMAHGEAGIVHALRALATVTGDQRLRVAAAAAAAREDRHFDPDAGNWADLREPEERFDGGPGARCAMAWCNGAPGIVLSRGSAAGEAFDGCASARDGVLRWLQAAVGSGRGNWSLCHGVPGVSEALLVDRSTVSEELAAGVAETILDQARRGIWRCGVPHGTTPGLMLGIAGIALFALRLTDSSIPSVLTIVGDVTAGSAFRGRPPWGGSPHT